MINISSGGVGPNTTVQTALVPLQYNPDTGQAWAQGASIILPVPASSGTYLGQIATGALVCYNFTTSSHQQMTRTGHYARDNITSLQVAFPNWYVAIAASGAETALGTATATIEAAIEYPIGVFNRVTFSNGQITGNIPALTTTLSDPISITIPSGALFFVRNFYTNTDGLVTCSSGMGSQSNEGNALSNLVVTAGAIANNNFCYPPCAIVAQTTKSSIGLVGDSRLVGSGETFNALFYYRGHVQRIIGPTHAYMCVASFSDQLQWAVASYTQRNLLLQYVSHIVCDYGYNDMQTGGQTPANTLSKLQTLYGFSNIVGKKIWQMTLEPGATSTDAFITEANQTPVTSNANRISFNASLRAGIASVQGIIDWTGPVEESFTTSGVWQAPTGTGTPVPTSAITTDGVHLNTFGCLRVQSIGPQIPTFSR